MPDHIEKSETSMKISYEPIGESEDDALKENTKVVNIG